MYDAATNVKKIVMFINGSRKKEAANCVTIK